MSIPEYPINPTEQYLANIATGEGELPPHPVTREEQYLEYIALHGGGGGGGDGDITKATLAPNFSTSTAYTAGEYVWHSGKLYRFTMAHEAGSWTGTDVEEAPLSSGISDLKSAIDGFGDTYAKQDGSYDSMTVGNAKQLVATVGVEDKVPYNFRTTGGSADVGDRKTMELVGGTVAWNQLSQPNGTSGVAHQLTWSLVDGVLTATGTPESDINAGAALRFGWTNKAIPVGHVVLFTPNTNDSRFQMRIQGTYALTGDAYPTRILKITADGALFDGVAQTTAKIDAGATVNAIMKPQIIDLTQMFGSTIANYIYALETANAGAGVAWFRKLFPKPYYAYNAGTLMSVKTSANVTTGFNQFNEQWEDGYYWDVTDGQKKSGSNWKCSDYIPCLPQTGYYCFAQTALSGSMGYLCFYDGAKNYLGYNSWSAGNINFTTPENAYYMTLYASKTLTDLKVCINISWDGERDGEYEPYVAHEYALDPDLELRGIPKLDSDNSLYYDGDTYESDGTVTRRFSAVDLGSLSWTKESNHFYSPAIADAKLPSSNSAPANAMCVKYVNMARYYVYSETEDKRIAISNTGRIYVYDSAYTDAATFKTAVNGVYLVYELATPTTESADPYTTPQIVDDFGTEEFVDTRDVLIPVGHDTVYQANLRAKLEMAPDSPSGDGDYIVRHSNGQNAYVPLTFPADELPAAPTTDGSYVLKATVADGAATYTWEAQS